MEDRRMSKLTIRKEDAVLVAIDFQVKLMANMHGKEKVEDTICRFVRGLRLFEIPILVTQQYTKGIGPTTPDVTAALTEKLSDTVSEPTFTLVEKMTFSAMREPDFVKALGETGKKTVLLTGMESHICVLQTAMDLIEAGYRVFGVVDCMASRTTENKELAQVRMTQAGVIITSYEAVLFELANDSKDPNFKQIASIVK
jgi:nicotinamidase-related amidase